jgi:hypothetical protein
MTTIITKTLYLSLALICVGVLFDVSTPGILVGSMTVEEYRVGAKAYETPENDDARVSVGPALPLRSANMVVGLSLAIMTRQHIHIRAELLPDTFLDWSYNLKPTIRTPCCPMIRFDAGEYLDEQHADNLLACVRSISSITPDAGQYKDGRHNPRPRIGILTQVTRGVLPYAAFAAAVNAAWAATFNHTFLIEGPMAGDRPTPAPWDLRFGKVPTSTVRRSYCTLTAH